MAIICEWTRPGDDPCCCPEDCCLYPFPDPEGILGGPFYPPDDLPATIVVNGVTLTLNAGTYTYGTLSFSDTFVFAGPVLVDGIPVGDGFTTWALYIPPREEFTFNSCLIGTWPPLSDEVEDEFLNTYAITFPNASPDGDITGSVTRETLCRWEGTGSDGVNSWAIIMEFIVDPLSTQPGGYIVWKASATSGTSSDQPVGYKLSPEEQSDPEGDYSTESPIVVVAIVTP